MPAVDVVGDYDFGGNTESSGDDNDEDERDKDSDDDVGNASFHANSNSDDDANDSNDSEFNRAHKPLRGNFKTVEGISVSIVKGSIADQKVSGFYVHLLVQ